MDDKEKYILETIRRKEKISEKNKIKRTLIVIILVSIISFSILMIRNKTTGIEILWTLLGSLLFGALYFFINSIIFSYLYSKSEKEEKEINELKNKYNVNYE